MDAKPKKTARIADHFASLTDPRTRKVLHPLMNVLTIAITAVICGADDFVAIAEFGRKKREWFERFLDLKNGIPSHDRFNQIFAKLNPDEFEKCLTQWITNLHEVTAGQLIAIDGKTLRGSSDKAGAKLAIHMVGAWATENNICLGQLQTDEKSNEITAIPKLLEILDISGALVSIDAMGCQKKIADKIVKSGADYLLSVKNNQRKLRRTIVAHFDALLAGDMNSNFRKYETEETGHGRHETRIYYITPAPQGMRDKGWNNLRAIGYTLNRTIRAGKESIEVRYYILSKYLTSRKFAASVRGHWSIENSLHWQLDVSFGEDGCQIRKGHADANFSSVRRLSLGLLKNERTAKVGVKNKRLSAGWDEEYLEKVLLG